MLNHNNKIITLLCIVLSFGCGISKPSQVSKISDPVPDEIASDSFATPYLDIKIKARYITSDKLQQCYVVTPKNELIKYNAKGESLFQYNNNTLGGLDWVDVTDPFNLLLFYPEYLTVITLDRTLSKTGEYQLYGFNLIEINAIAMSNDNYLWLFDETSSHIIKLNQQGKTINESANLNLLLGSRLMPNFMIENNNLLYVNVPEKGILVFDSFATYLKTIPIKGLKRFQILGQQLIFEEEGKVFAFHLLSLLTERLKLPCPYVIGDQIRVQKDVLFLLKSGHLLFYKI